MSDEELLRTHEFTADGPITLDVGIGAGRIDVQLTDGDPAVRVELRHDPSAGTPWSHGISSTLSWLSEQFGEQIGPELHGSPATAADQTRIDMVGDRLVVRAPKALPLRHVPFAVTVRAQVGSALEVRSASARVTSTGDAGSADVRTTSGDVALERVSGPVTVHTGSGSVSLGQVCDGLHVRCGGGDVRIAGVTGSASVATGTGSVRVGTCDGELTVRSGSGDLAVADAGSGEVNLKTGSGEVRVAVRNEVLAEVDLSSATGSVTSELDVSTEEPEEPSALRVRGRSGTGNATIAGAP